MDTNEFGVVVREKKSSEYDYEVSGNGEYVIGGPQYNGIR